VELETDADEPAAARAACRRKLEMLPLLVTDGRGDEGGLGLCDKWPAADDEGRG
jgi:hypothetical protein